MAGAVLAGIGAGGANATGSVVISPAVSWTNIYAYGVGSTNTQTIAGIGSGVTISASITGTGQLSYSQNGNLTLYSGAFTAHLGDTLSWMVEAPGSSRVTGTITVTNVSNGSATIGSIAYSIASSPY